MGSKQDEGHGISLPRGGARPAFIIEIRKLSIVVPCFNEEGSARRFERELLDYFQSFPFACEFIFIDDGSTDSTLSVLENLEKRHPRVTVLRHLKNQGMGVALRNGFDRCSGDAVLALDADLTFHPQDFPCLLEAYSPDVDCVMGSPFLGQFEKVSIHRRLLSRVVNSLYSRLFGLRVTSTSCIFRLYRAPLLRRIDLKSRSFDINAEILFRLLQQGGRVKEVAVRLSQRTEGRSKIRYYHEITNHVRMFWRIFKWRYGISFKGNGRRNH